MVAARDLAMELMELDVAHLRIVINVVVTMNTTNGAQDAPPTAARLVKVLLTIAASLVKVARRWVVLDSKLRFNT